VCLLPGRGQGVWRKGDVVARRLAMEPPNTLHETGLGTTASGSHVRTASAADWHVRRVESRPLITPSEVRAPCELL
jgi:hypothetical protein